MSIEKLLSRVEEVRTTGHGKYVARCPAHDDKSPSLAIKECSDGRILIHDFAGCETEDVLAAVGMTFSDIMPEKVGTEHTYRPQKWLNARDALATLNHESLVVSVIGSDLLEHEEIDEETWFRLAAAVSRINTTRATCAPARAGR